MSTIISQDALFGLGILKDIGHANVTLGLFALALIADREA